MDCTALRGDWEARAWGPSKHTGEPLVTASVSRYLVPAKRSVTASGRPRFIEAKFYKSSCCNYLLVIPYPYPHARNQTPTRAACRRQSHQLGAAPGAPFVLLQRLLLRPLRLEDAEDVLLMRKHPEVMKHTSLLPSDDLEGTKAWIQGVSLLPYIMHLDAC